MRLPAHRSSPSHCPYRSVRIAVSVSQCPYRSVRIAVSVSWRHGNQRRIAGDGHTTNRTRPIGAGDCCHRRRRALRFRLRSRRRWATLTRSRDGNRRPCDEQARCSVPHPPPFGPHKRTPRPLPHVLDVSTHPSAPGLRSIGNRRNVPRHPIRLCT